MKRYVSASTVVNYEELESKQVEDPYDGFSTDLTLYKKVGGEEYIIILGDKDLYDPTNADPEFDPTTSYEEAKDQFDYYD